MLYAVYSGFLIFTLDLKVLRRSSENHMLWGSILDLSPPLSPLHFEVYCHGSPERTLVKTSRIELNS